MAMATSKNCGGSNGSESLRLERGQEGEKFGEGEFFVEEDAAAGDIAGLADRCEGLSLVGGGSRLPGREEEGGGRLGTDRRIGSSGGRAAGVIPGVAAVSPGVAGAIVGVAGSVPGVAGSIPGGGSGETIMAQGFGACGWEWSLSAVVWLELEGWVGIWDVGWT